MNKIETIEATFAECNNCSCSNKNKHNLDYVDEFVTIEIDSTKIDICKKYMDELLKQLGSEIINFKEDTTKRQKKLRLHLNYDTAKAKNARLV